MYEFRFATKENLPEIKKLQDINHYRNLTPEQMAKNGFVSLETDIPMLEKILDDNFILIAKSKDNIVGYELPLTLKRANESPLIVPFVDMLLDITYQGKKISEYKTVIGGQICVVNAHKGAGLAVIMHDKFTDKLAEKYDLLVTEVSNKNMRSITASTKKLGFELVKEYEAEGRQWYVILYDLRKKQSEAV
jgi:hypothetical protein